MTDTTTATSVGGARDDAVDALLARMTLEEKLAAIVGLWSTETSAGEEVAPLQEAMATELPPFERFAEHGLGHLTRIFGSAPVEPEEGRRELWRRQRHLVDGTRLGIPAVAHEECLTGLAAWRATTYPVPPAWGATFDPALVGEMAAAIGEQMAGLGVHQGLAPVLDVVRDPRWGRVEECIGEDPYLVGEVGTAYVRGLQSAGVLATLKHFVGYSASRAGRNLAPVSAGPREVSDVLLVPFEMAVLDGGARSVMHSYAEIDGVPVAGDPALLHGVLRDRWGFDGTVVADYFGIAFLQTLHRVAGDLGEAAAQALAAGVDIELPTGHAYLAPLAEAVRAGTVPVELVDRAVRRTLAQKAELGLLAPDAIDQAEPSGAIDLDPPEHRAIAARVAEESVVLLGNDGTLPLAAPARVAVLGPNADRAHALFGCYSFVNHVLDHHPEVPLGIEAPTVLEALRAELGERRGAEVTYARGCGVQDFDRSGIAEAAELAAAADVAVVVVGDHAGLFGRGTSGEGCDADSLELPGVQRDLVEAVLATGTPVVLVLLTGRPYAVGWAVERCAAVVQAFFPGEEGARAVAGVLSGRVNPSGRLPMSLPRSAGAQPFSYLHPPLGGPSDVTTADPTPARPFGFGLGYTTFEHTGLEVPAEVPTDGSLRVRVTVTNTGDRAGAEVVQVYAHDVVASVTRPVAQLVAFHRVELAPGQRAVVELDVPTTRLAFSDRRMVRVVEPGEVQVWVGRSAADPGPATTTTLVGPVHSVTVADRREVRTAVHPA
ncbi:glycoside hydrolase family 3 C-terminal domain-containing protein [Actinotalea sp. M2MS4P-6]|uniref:beta-xylosidase/alpha-l-arabinosidase n=1 Tax=Actinotalea sp. M2MS4P-6 TaxID=2983762 RepID=UPI0021E46450|nr:glycoside hydrolase family 3 N-terminal domain-containing protein [Actinotalea sp. M2MS4P-6]MCV2395014.1 glycoside hydrolase family 3 C-terminal domain-containing protein [Actinotalea sp. M2MS4P-6]